jgi:hypothetical protein
LNGLKTPGVNQHWYIKYTRPRLQYAQSGLIPVTQVNNKLTLPNPGWREAELYLMTDQYTLPPNQWHQISLPATPPAQANTVGDVLADDITGTYASDWIVYFYDPVDNRYVDPGLTGTLQQGVGYWIIQNTGSTATLALPAGSTVTPVAISAACASFSGCYDIPLSTVAGGNRWNMAGHAFASGVRLSRVRVTTHDGVCASGCTLDAARAANIVHNELWHYKGESYARLDSSSNATLIPWSGFWNATLPGAHTLAPKLLDPGD